MADKVEISEDDLDPRPSPSSSPLDVSSFAHTQFYCEENVYLLCKTLSAIGVADPMGADLFVVFISNEEKKVPIWYQKASREFDGLVIWDYHVICIQAGRNERNTHHLVWDLDSSLPFPTPLGQYLNKAIQPLLSSNLMRFFRVVHAPTFLHCFSSDRSHMKDDIGNWIAVPPPYKPIVAEDGTVNNLNEYIQIGATDALVDVKTAINVFSKKYGVVVSETLLEEMFSHVHLQ